jgi:ankyrin repeat protein
LHCAVFNGHMEIVNLLLEKGADVNLKDNFGTTPLKSAALNGHMRIVKLLLEKGADVNLTDKYDKTPLHWAVFNGHMEIVNLLLEKGADVDLKDNFGNTSFYCALIKGYIEIVKLLLLINLIKVDGYKLDITDYEISLSLSDRDRLNKLVNVDRFKANIKYFIENNFLCPDIKDIKEDIDKRDKLEIFLMILSFKKFFNCVVNVKNYVEIRDFIKSINSDKFESYKTYIDKIDDNIRVFRKSMDLFQNNLFRTLNISDKKSNFSDLDINFN